MTSWTIKHLMEVQQTNRTVVLPLYDLYDNACSVNSFQNWLMISLKSSSWVLRNAFLQIMKYVFGLVTNFNLTVIMFLPLIPLHHTA